MEQKAISSDLIRGHIDTIILHTLISGDKFAQQISDCINEKSNNQYQINQATLYSSLKRLEGLKHLKSYWNDSETGRRKYFRITESGRVLVEQNLSSWSYSRTVIDKLMDCSPQPVIIERVEKVVETKPSITNNSFSPVENFKENNKVDFNAVLPNETKLNTVKDQDKDNDAQINFRNILNGLIKNATVTHVNEDIETISVENMQQSQDVVKKIHETLDANHTVQKDYSIGKVDLSELSAKAVKEGYKLRISSKDSYVDNGTLLINKLNLITSSIVFVLSLIIFFILKIALKRYLTIEILPSLLIVLGLVAYPLITAIIYALRPNTTTAKIFGPDTVFISLIIVFNLTLVTFAGNLLFNVDFSDTKTILMSMVFPAVVYLMIFIHYLVKSLISKSKICKKTNNEKHVAFN